MTARSIDSLTRDLRQEIDRREKALQVELAPLRTAIATLAGGEEQSEGQERPEPVTVEQVRSVVEERFGDGRWFRTSDLADALGGGVSQSTLRNRVMALLEEGALRGNGERGRGAALCYVADRPDDEPRDEAA
jgi:hypothetical protein